MSPFNYFITSFISSTLRPLKALVVITICYGCSGPSTEQENPIYVGYAMDSYNTPVNDAIVHLYRESGAILSDTSRPAADYLIDSTWTDRTGRFTFENMDPGRYNYAIQETKKNLTGLRKSVFYHPSEQNRIPDTLILSNAGIISGQVTRGGLQGTGGNSQKQDAFITVLIKEIARHIITGYEGTFEFYGLPEGTYTLCFYADDGFFTIRVDSVKVTSGARTVLDTVTLQRIPWIPPPKPTGLSAEYDTLGKVVTLRWNAVNISTIRGYEVVRFDSDWKENGSFTTIDTLFTDNISSFPSGTILSYVVRSVSLVFERSYNEGPVDIVVR